MKENGCEPCEGKRAAEAGNVNSRNSRQTAEATRMAAEAGAKGSSNGRQQAAEGGHRHRGISVSISFSISSRGRPPASLPHVCHQHQEGAHHRLHALAVRFHQVNRTACSCIAGRLRSTCCCSCRGSCSCRGCCCSPGGLCHFHILQLLLLVCG